MISHSTVLIENGTGNGTDKQFKGGKAAFTVEATFGGATVKLQIKLGQGTYCDVTSASLTAAGMVVVDLPPGTYRAVAGVASAVYANLSAIPM